MAMKRLSVVILLLELAGCKYPSYEQARNACEKWSNEVEPVSNTYVDFHGKTRTKDLTARRCKDESKTSQVLGWENEFVLKGKYRPFKSAEDYKVVKHFRY